MKINILITLLCLFIASCAPSGKAIYKDLSLKNPLLSAKDAAIQDANQSLEIDKEITFEITKNDKVFIDENIFASYKTFSFSAVNIENIELEIRTLCDCLGINKYILIPKIQLFDSAQEQAELFLIEKQVLKPRDVFPASILYRYGVKLKAGEKYRILIWADNSSIDKNVAELEGTILMPVGGYAFMPIDSTYNLTSHPFGKLIIRLTN